MRILIVANVHFPVNDGSYMGGIETIVGETFKAINSTTMLEDHEAHIAVTKDSKIGDQWPGRVYRHDKNSVWEIKKDPNVKRVMFGVDTLRLAEYCEDNKIDAIYSNVPRVPIVRELATLGLPVIHLLHQGIFAHFDFHTYQGINEIKNITPNFKVMAVSNYVMSNVNSSIPGMVDGVLNPSIVNGLPPVETGVVESKWNFVTAGRIQPNYFIKELAEAVYRAGYSIAVAGTINDYENNGYARDFLRLVEESEGKIHYAGQLPHDELMELFGCSSAYITPIDHEAYGMAALEAASMGLSICGFGNDKITGITDFINNDSKSNFFFHPVQNKFPNSVDEIANTLRSGTYWWLSDTGQAVRQVMANKFRAKYNTRNYISKLVDEFKALGSAGALR